MTLADHQQFSQDETEQMINEVPSSDGNGPRKSARDKRVLIWMTDYVTVAALDQSDKPYSLCNSVSYDGLKSSYQHYLTAFSAITEPQTFHEASKDKRWIEAMKAEIQAL